MQQTIEKAVLKFDWGIPASVGAHALVLALLVFGLPQFHHTPDEPKAIDVALVPPPEPVKPAESKPEEKKVEEKKPQEKKVEEKKPEEKKPEERQTEPVRQQVRASKVDKPTQAKQQEQDEAAKKAEQEQAAKKAEQEAAAKKAEQEAAARKAEQEAAARKAEQEAAARGAEQEAAARKAEQEAAARKAEQEAAARKAEQEAAARKAKQEAAARKAEQEAAAKKAEQEAAARKAEQEAVAKKAEQEAAARKAEQEQAAKKAEQEQAAKQAEAGQQSPIKTLRPVLQFGEKDTGPRKSEDGNAARDASLAALPDDPKPLPKNGLPENVLSAAPGIPSSQIPNPDAVPVPEPSPKPPARQTLQALQGKPQTVHSQSDSGDPVATTAMGNLPRGIRAGELCATALREELRNYLPPIWPDLLPSYRLDKGTILQVHKGAFRANGLWYNLSFRCEVDDAVTRVTSFDVNVGEPIPRDQWRARGFPES